MLVRDFLSKSLYHSKNAYFRTKNCVYKVKKPISFDQLTGRGQYLLKLEELYKSEPDAFVTPVELFRPWYSRSLGYYILKRHSKIENAGNLNIFEIGGGNGTNALHILDFLKEVSPSLYNNINYTLIEISDRMAERQIDSTFRHKDKVKVIQKDFLDWDLPTFEDNCFVIALEVFDNLPHDKIIRTKNNSGNDWWIFNINDINDWKEIVITQIDDNLFEEKNQTLNDPLIIRTAELFLTQKKSIWNETNEESSKFSLAKWTRKGLLKTRERMEKFSDKKSLFIPSGSLKFLDVLSKKFPKHQIIIADYTVLPPLEISWWHQWKSRNIQGSLLGCRNSPLVASKVDNGKTIDSPTYLVPLGSCDIFFQTDFQALCRAYQKIIGRPAYSLKTEQFMKEYTEHSYCRTLSGYNPLLEDFHNTAFLISS